MYKIKIAVQLLVFNIWVAKRHKIRRVIRRVELTRRASAWFLRHAKRAVDNIQFTNGYYKLTCNDITNEL